MRAPPAPSSGGSVAFTIGTCKRAATAQTRSLPTQSSPEQPLQTHQPTHNRLVAGSKPAGPISTRNDPEFGTASLATACLSSRFPADPLGRKGARSAALADIGQLALPAGLGILPADEVEGESMQAPAAAPKHLPAAGHRCSASEWLGSRWRRRRPSQLALDRLQDLDQLRLADPKRPAASESISGGHRQDRSSAPAGAARAASAGALGWLMKTRLCTSYCPKM